MGNNAQTSWGKSFYVLFERIMILWPIWKWKCFYRNNVVSTIDIVGQVIKPRIDNVFCMQIRGFITWPTICIWTTWLITPINKKCLGRFCNFLLVIAGDDSSSPHRKLISCSNWGQVTPIVNMPPELLLAKHICTTSVQLLNLLPIQWS